MTSEEYQNIEREIVECYAMIDHFIMIGNKEEIATWRRYLQTAKKMKREARRTD